MASMLTKREEDVSQDVFEAEMKITKARVLLNDLLNDYNFDKEPDEKDIRTLAYSAKKVLTFMTIINDYVFEAEKSLEQAQIRFKDDEEEDASNN